MDSLIEKLNNELHSKKELYLNFKVRANSAENKFQSALEDGTIKMLLKGKPEKGLANKELIKYLSKIFLVDKKNINIISGKTDRNKLVKIKI